MRTCSRRKLILDCNWGAGIVLCISIAFLFQPLIADKLLHPTREPTIDCSQIDEAELSEFVQPTGRNAGDRIRKLRNQIIEMIKSEDKQIFLNLKVLIEKKITKVKKIIERLQMDLRKADQCKFDKRQKMHQYRSFKVLFEKHLIAQRTARMLQLRVDPKNIDRLGLEILFRALASAGIEINTYDRSEYDYGDEYYNTELETGDSYSLY